MHIIKWVIVMNKLDEFKIFIKDKPFLQEKVKNKEATWQSLYETYDLFGADADVFKDKKSEEQEVRNSSANTNNSILKMLEGVNLDKISENLEGMKKILGVLGEFTKKDDIRTSRRSTNRTPRRFDD